MNNQLNPATLLTTSLLALYGVNVRVTSGFEKSHKSIYGWNITYRKIAADCAEGYLSKRLMKPLFPARLLMKRAAYMINERKMITISLG